MRWQVKLPVCNSRSQSDAKLGADDQDFLRIRGGLSLGDVGPIFIVDGTGIHLILILTI